MHPQRLIASLGASISRAFRALAPDPFVISVLLLLATCLLALLFGDFGKAEGGIDLLTKCSRLADSFRDTGTNSHIWSLLAFSMQMCLVLVSGHILASAPPVRRLLASLANLPSSGHAAAATVGFVACLTGVVNWGLGLIVGAVLAREIGQSLARRNIPHHYPIIAAAGYFGLMVWHGGLSGSAPLTMTSLDGARRTLPPDLVQSLVAAGFSDGVPLTHTLLSTSNLIITPGLVLLVPAALWLLTPRPPAPLEPAPALPTPAPPLDPPSSSLPDILERAPWISWTLAIALAAGTARFLQVSSLSKLGINEITGAMLALGLVLHASPRRFLRAADEAASACSGIIIQFPIYAAIIAVMVNAGLIQVLADLATDVNPRLLPLTTFIAACIINLFVPSGGGQWAVQGPISLQAALNAGVHPGKIIMAVAYGDQLTNMLQPFWALPLLAITNAKARDIVGYTALVMLAGGAWIATILILL